jgi:plasmid stabilization system protein ParE
MSYRIRFTLQAEDDSLRMFDSLLEQDVDVAARAEIAINKGVEVLDLFPFSCRKAGDGHENPFLRELLIPFGVEGYVVLFEIEGRDVVTIIAVRHQREADYH